jgi:hypothetical protein
MKPDIVKKLFDKINFNSLNHDIIDYNSLLLYNYFIDLKKIYNDLPLFFEHQQLKELDTNEKQFFENSFLYNNPEIKKFLKNTNSVIKLKFENISFFYLSDNDDTYKSDIKLINKLMKTTITLSKIKKNKKNISIIWVPIDKNRDFEHEILDDHSLNKCQHNFQAFTASGVTSSNISIITRYEEIKKLLIHELIHNLNMDSSDEHDTNDVDIINKYYDIKNNNNYKYKYDIYESYTETLSSYLNILFHYIHKDIKPEHIKACILIEFIYSCNVLSNIIKINGYSTYDDFYNGGYFKGSICVYEYYYLKCLMYNNFKLPNINNVGLFSYIVTSIITMNKYDLVLKYIFDIHIPDNNYRYVIITD